MQYTDVAHFWVTNFIKKYLDATSFVRNGELRKEFCMGYYASAEEISFEILNFRVGLEHTGQLGI